MCLICDPDRRYGPRCRTGLSPIRDARDERGRAAMATKSNVREIPDGPADESGLTPRQRKVLEVIRDSVERRGYPPTVREIGEAVGLTSTSSVSHQLMT